MEKKVVAFDLDDTLLAEIDFLHSAFSEIALTISKRYGVDYDECLKLMKSSKEAFSTMNLWLKSQGYNDVLTVEDMIEMYRNHKPEELSFIEGASELLDYLKAKEYIIAVITDGRINTQSAKIKALGLEKQINPDDIIISEATGHDKHSSYNFEYLEAKHADATSFIYMADNPSKDFEHPNLLGWTTIALRDTIGRNIHKQDFDLPYPFKPVYIIESLLEARNIIA